MIFSEQKQDFERALPLLRRLTTTGRTSSFPFEVESPRSARVPQIRAGVVLRREKRFGRSELNVNQDVKLKRTELGSETGGSFFFFFFLFLGGLRPYLLLLIISSNKSMFHRSSGGRSQAGKLLGQEVSKQSKQSKL